MKNENFMSESMKYLKKDYSDLYEGIVTLNENVFSGKVLDLKTQKLIAIAMVCGTSDDRAIEAQMKNGMQTCDISAEEIVDVLRIVLLISGKPAFTKSLEILYSLVK